MMRSMFSGVSALRAHQLKMDVIANNIANVNTVGFKSSSVSFAEMYSQTLAGASSSTANRGGTNPQQVGLGTSVAGISVDHSKGSVQRTDVATDLMVDGTGFFMVTDDANGQNKYYTRAGNFDLDESGFLVTKQGLKVLDKDFKPIQINMSDTKTATQTTGITVKGNLNFNDSDYTTTIDLYDSLGKTHTMNLNFVGAPISTSTPLTVSNGTIAGNDPLNASAVGAHNYSYRKITITDPSTDPATQKVPGASDPTLYAMFNEDGEIVDVVNLTTDGDADTQPKPPTSAPVLTVTAPGASNISFNINRNMFFLEGDPTNARSFTQYSQESDAKGVQLSGNSAGTISSFNISSKGEVIGIYTNGEQKVLQTIGLADFDNPPGLLKVGNNLFKDSPNSGTPKYGTPSSGSFGALTPGALEMSNVDLSKQFTEMITTQRGFQANSRVITTSDEILQELVNLKR